MLASWGRRHKRKAQTPYINKVFSSVPVFDNIFAHLDAGDAIRLGKTCYRAKKAYNHFFYRGHNIDKLLRRFFDNPNAFRYIQAATGTLISGSSALQFLDRSFYPDSDLDLYTPRHHCFQVGEWILSQGYTYKPTEKYPDFHNAAQDLQDDDEHDDYVKGTDYRTTGICAVYEFRKRKAVVQLIAARHSPFHAIISFHSTCVMNFITYEAGYSLYPAATFDRRMAVCNGTIEQKELAALTKYRQRGWNIASDIRWCGKENMEKLFFTGNPRWVMDSHSWRVPLKELNPPPEPRLFSPLSRSMEFDPAVTNSWRLGRNSEVNNTTGYFFASKLLKYRYMFADKDLARTVMRFLKEQGQLQYQMLEAKGVEAQDAPHSEAWSWWDGALKEIYEDHFIFLAEQEKAKESDDFSDFL